MGAIIIISIVLVLLSASLYVKYRSERQSNVRLRAVINHQRDYSFLIDHKFEVKETNISLPTNGEPNVLGNVLHCNNAHEAGRCGEGQACKFCPVRFVIRKSFERQGDFEALDACMEIYQGDNHVKDVDVSLDGRFVNIGTQPHMVVNVKDAAGQSELHMPKILFASKDLELYQRTRSALRRHFRLLHADNEHQVVHRLMMQEEYKFCALISDEHFLKDNAVIMDLLERVPLPPVIVLGSSDEPVEWITYINKNATDQEILDCCIRSCSQS